MPEEDWLTGLDNSSVEQELSLVLRALDPCLREPVFWTGVPVQYGHHEGVFIVGADALMLRHPTGAFRLSVSGMGAQMLCDGLHLQMPTPLMIDRIWENAIVRVKPKTYTPDSSGRVHVQDRSGRDITVSMSGLAAMIAHSDRVNEFAGDPTRLMCNVGKWWVICKALSGQAHSANHGDSYRCANYGWFDAGAPGLSVTGKHIWQSIGTRHNQHHRDYSQTFVPIGSRMLVDGVVMPVSDVLVNPELAGLISHEGALPFARHPNLPVSQLTGACNISPDPHQVQVRIYAPDEAPTHPGGD